MRAIIYFDIDEKGNFLPSHRERGFAFGGYGFEEVAENAKGSFRLNYAEALTKAKSLGVTETDSSKAFGHLYWESFRRMNIINGQFRFYIRICTKEIEQVNSDGITHTITKYDVYVFNPWTTEFIEKKKMKTEYWLGKNTGRWTGLRPDKD